MPLTINRWQKLLTSTPATPAVEAPATTVVTATNQIISELPEPDAAGVVRVAARHVHARGGDEDDALGDIGDRAVHRGREPGAEVAQALLQLAIAGSMFWRSTLPLGAAGIVALYLCGISAYGLFHMMDYPIFLGLAAYHALSASPSEVWRAGRANVLRIGGAATFARTGAAYYLNAQGVLVSAATGVARTAHVLGGLPLLLLVPSSHREFPG